MKKKSYLLALFLVLMLGPLGLFYTSTAAALSITTTIVVSLVIATGIDAAKDFFLLLTLFLLFLTPILQFVFVARRNKEQAKQAVDEARHRELVDAVAKRDNAD